MTEDEAPTVLIVCLGKSAVAQWCPSTKSMEAAMGPILVPSGHCKAKVPVSLFKVTFTASSVEEGLPCAWQSTVDAKRQHRKVVINAFVPDRFIPNSPMYFSVPLCAEQLSYRSIFTRNPLFSAPVKKRYTVLFCSCAGGVVC